VIARVPKQYKAVYLGHETEAYLIAGGYDAGSNTSSNICFLLKDGAISEVMEMYTARQNHSLIHVQTPNKSDSSQKLTFAYAIGGYNNKEGRALVEVERYD